MAYFLLFLTVCVLSSRGMLMKYASAGGSNLAQMIVIFGTASIGSLLLGLATGMLQIHASTVMYAVMFGVFNFLSQYLYLRAMKTGMASKVVFISSCSFLLTSIFSIIAFREPLTVFKALGIAMVCCAQVCFSLRRGEVRNSNAKDPWFILAIVSMVCSGLVGISQKLLGKSAYPNEVIGLSFIATTIAALLPSLLLSVKHEWKEQFAVMKNRRTLALSVVLGFVAVAMNTLSTYVATLIDGSIVFPVTNCGNLILSMFLGRLLFKDKLTKLQQLSVMLGIVAIVVIGL